VVLSDTVGFVRKLPTTLVEAFQSTLEVVAESDLLVHVVDGSASDPEGQMDAVRGVLAEIGAGEVPELVAFNKVDRLGDGAAPAVPLDRLLARHPGSVALSALAGDGIDGFLTALADRLRALETVVELRVPYDRGDVLAAVHREGEVLLEAHEPDATRVRARLDDAAVARFREFAVTSDDGRSA
jgi:GTP-binding protein HflX